MRKVLLLAAFALLFGVGTQGQSNDEAAVRKLFEDQLVAILKGDTQALEQIFADDFVVTNPFNQFLTKKQVIERTVSGQISMKSFERKLDYVKVYGDFAVVAGMESGVWGDKMPRAVAGRITAVARKVNGRWWEVARHASVVLPTPAQAK